MYTVQDDDLDEDGISIGPGALDPQGATFGDDRGGNLYADLRAPDNMVLAGHAITNDRERRVDGSLTEDERPPASASAVHPEIIGVSVVAPAYGDTFYPGERISVAVRHNRSVRVSGHSVPVLTLDIGGNLRTARFDRARFLREQVFVAVGDADRRPEDGPGVPAALYSGAERLWFSYAVGADDSDADGISIPSDGLGTPNSKVIVSRTREDLGDSLAGTVLSRYPGRKVAPHADAAGTVWASHAGVAHDENTGGSVAYRQPTLDGSPVWSPGRPDAQWFTLDPSTGALAWRSAPDRESPSDADEDNAHIVRPTASVRPGRRGRLAD